MALMPVFASAQTSSINTFSPFTFYGLGDFHVQGAADLRAMGGAAVGYRLPWAMQAFPHGVVNTVNPAALSAIPRKSFHFNFGLEGSNHYLKSTDKKTSFNTFNIRDISYQMPLHKRLAFGISLSPYSSVGYRTEIDEQDQSILDQLYEGGAIGAKYLYDGDGDITQGKLSLGWQPFESVPLSLGVDMVYYFGKITRNFSTNILTKVPDAGYINSKVQQTESISRIMWNLGLQYNIISNNHRMLTFGATYHPGGDLNPEISTRVVNSLSIVQTINNGLAENFKMPTTVSAGLFYQTWRLSAGLDYTYQDWAGKNDASEITGTAGSVDMKFQNTNSIKGGLSFTPNRRDVRRVLPRLTYRVGFRYSDYYMKFNDTGISDKAVTVGLGIPFKITGNSYVDLGVELGQRGTTKSNLIKENYFKVSLGFRLFGTDSWFMKLMYD